jgi:hypothetical protein
MSVKVTTTCKYTPNVIYSIKNVGEVLYHRYQNKSPEEAAKLQSRVSFMNNLYYSIYSSDFYIQL